MSQRVFTATLQGDRMRVRARLDTRPLAYSKRARGSNLVVAAGLGSPSASIASERVSVCARASSLARSLDRRAAKTKGDRKQPELAVSGAGVGGSASERFTQAGCASARTHTQRLAATRRRRQRNQRLLACSCSNNNHCNCHYYYYYFY